MIACVRYIADSTCDGGCGTQVKAHMFYMTGFVEAHRTFGEAFHMLF